MTVSPTINIHGAGIIGLSCALELKMRGANVRVLDPNPPELGASWAAAGMLSPGFEASDDDVSDGYFGLCLRSKAIWARFAHQIESLSGIRVGHVAGPSYAVGLNQEQAEQLEKLLSRLNLFDAACSRLSVKSLREQEPAINESVVSAIEIADDGWVDNRKIMLGLRKVLAAELVQCVERLPADADVELYTAWSAISGQSECLLPDALQALVQQARLKPIAGRMHAYRSEDLGVSRVIRCGHEYVVPRGDVSLFGATVGEVPDADAYLRSAAQTFLALRSHVELIDQWDGYRPRFGDKKLRVGPVSSNAFIAMGHYRNGILLAPITAQIIADQILVGSTPKYATGLLP